MDNSSLSEQHIKILRKSILQVTGEKHVSWKEVQEKVEQGDIIYTFALALAKRKIEGMLSGLEDIPKNAL